MDMSEGVKTLGLGIWGIWRMEGNTDGIKMTGGCSTGLALEGIRAHWACFYHSFWDTLIPRSDRMEFPRLET